jgi:NAD-dependent SIR2 family protein deacetylase
MPLDVDRVQCTLEVCRVFVVMGTAGMVEPAVSFAGQKDVEVYLYRGDFTLQEFAMPRK